MEEIDLLFLDWKLVHSIMSYIEKNRLKFAVFKSEQEIEQFKIDLLFNDSVDFSSIRVRGPYQNPTSEVVLEIVGESIKRDT